MLARKTCKTSNKFRLKYKRKTLAHFYLLKLFHALLCFSSDTLVFHSFSFAQFAHKKTHTHPHVHTYTHAKTIFRREFYLWRQYFPLNKHTHFSCQSGCFACSITVWACSLLCPPLSLSARSLVKPKWIHSQWELFNNICICWNIKFVFWIAFTYANQH